MGPERPGTNTEFRFRFNGRHGPGRRRPPRAFGCSSSFDPALQLAEIFKPWGGRRPSGRFENFEPWQNISNWGGSPAHSTALLDPVLVPAAAHILPPTPGPTGHTPAQARACIPKVACVQWLATQSGLRAGGAGSGRTPRWQVTWTQPESRVFCIRLNNNQSTSAAA